MTTPPLRGLWLGLALLAAGCATEVPAPRVDYSASYDFSLLHRLALQPPGDGQAAGLAPERVAAINQALAAAVVEKGITVVEQADNADALLRWHLAGSDPAANAAYDSMSLYSCWRCGTAVADVGMPAWQPGTLVVDVLERREGRPLWRATVDTRLTPGGSALTDEERREAARTVLANFPPLP
ncbi:DUF4136 domain-containing protein [Parahaliea mediterranea]|uniref:DUF4136 domain-containing protein n=1 Tax=Parahaliea mediterranea TaxID=651086 RepID=UPI0013007077|nr:DUF4136 domain-containing protein [Parahaliea mediterranea]